MTNNGVDVSPFVAAVPGGGWRAAYLREDGAAFELHIALFVVRQSGRVELRGPVVPAGSTLTGYLPPAEPICCCNAPATAAGGTE